MTLTEYLNQEDPIRKPYVTLQDGEYVIGLVMNGYTTVNRVMEKLTQIFITDEKFVKEFGSIEYLMVGQTIYSVDSDGNPKGRSVFNI